LIVSNWLAIGRNNAAANGTLIVNSGLVQKAGGNNIVLGSLGGTGTLVVNGGQVLNNGMLWLGENAGANGTLYLNGGLIQASQVRPNGTGLASSTAYFNGGTLQATATNADFIQSAVFIQAGGLKFDSGVFDLTLATQGLQEDGASPGGGLTKLGSGSLTLANVANSYTGLTTVSNGTLRVDGSIPGAVTVKSGAKLGGNGTVGGVVTVDSGGSIGAGASIGALTLNSTPVLNGSVIAEVDRNGGTPLADLITVSGNLVYSGTLVLTNAGAPLQAGDIFTLFNAPNYSGSFTLVSQTPLQIVTWNTGNLTVDGTITVATVAPLSPPTITNTLSGSTLTLSWPAGYLGWILQSQTNSVNTGLSTTWFDVVGSGSSTTATITVDPGNPTVFYRLRSP
jgi:fibronectin-binding autotransporter adhesin